MGTKDGMATIVTSDPEIQTATLNGIAGLESDREFPNHTRNLNLSPVEKVGWRKVDKLGTRGISLT